ncbi:MAG: efflux RND transporter periplasmic adaptor subunit [Candidatus Gracilibacteria bacterium]|nr:efflux RND transporter periplasmic adaptor subunit [Candidatus Gracilibacteria bacterium]
MKKIISIILILVITLNITSCNKEEIKLSKYYKSTKAEIGSINLEDNYIGYIESETVSLIGSKQGGLINNIYVKEGDYINKGDIIAKIDSTESNTTLKYQEKMLQTINDLKSNVADNFDKQIDITDSLENQVKINLEGTKSMLELTKNIKDKEINLINSQIENTKTALETAKVELDQTKTVLDNKEKNLYSNGKNAITTSMIIDTNTINFIDKLLGIINKENDHNNDLFWNYLGARDIKQREIVVKEFSNIYNQYKDYKKIYEEQILNNTPNTSQIENTINIGINFNDNLRNFLKDFYTTLTNSIANDPNFTQNEINSYKDTVISFGNSIESALITVSGNYTLGLKGIQESITDFKTEKEKNLQLLQKKVDLANNSLNTINKSLEQAIEGNNLKITDVETKKQEVNEKLNEINKNKLSINSNKNSKITELDLENDKLNLSKELSLVSISNSVIRSPISGIVSKKMVEIGQVIVPSMPIIEISDPNNTKITYEVNDNTLTKIKQGDQVDISIEGRNELSKGVISKIYPIKNEITKKTKIEVISINKNNLKIGSIAKLYIKDESQKGIYVKNDSIIENYMIPGLYIIEENKKEKTKKISFKKINILKQNDEYSLIEGIKQGDEIITDGKENLYDGEILN